MAFILKGAVPSEAEREPLTRAADAVAEAVERALSGELATVITYAVERCGFRLISEVGPVRAVRAADGRHGTAAQCAEQVRRLRSRDGFCFASTDIEDGAVRQKSFPFLEHVQGRALVQLATNVRPGRAAPRTALGLDLRRSRLGAGPAGA
jgi:hypothetical protein